MNQTQQINYSNTNNISLSLAVFLASDDYDKELSKDIDTNIKHISATSLLKSVRQTILNSRVPLENIIVDLMAMSSSRIGTAIHNGIEKSWLSNYKQCLKALNYDDKFINRIKINPKPEELNDCIPVYLEKRTSKQINDWCVSGKFDFVINDAVEDFKTTSVFNYMSGNNIDDYTMQCSIYRWLNQDIIKEDYFTINYIFTDWSKASSLQSSNYPPSKIMSKKYPLLSIIETERYVTNKLKQLSHYWDSNEEDLPLCNDKELWRSEPVFKYYKDPNKTARSTKNFTSKQDAYIRLAEDNNVGIVKEIAGKVKACAYCPALSICSQKDTYLASGELTL